MKVYQSETNSFGESYKNLLNDLYHSPEFESSPRQQKINEQLGCAIVYDPRKCLYHNDRRSSQLKYIAAELVWYFNKSNDVNFINKFSKFWNTIVNPDGKTVNSAYGHLIFNELHSYNWINDYADNSGVRPETAYMTQWQWAIKQLTEDTDTRQAIMHYNKPHHQFNGNKDFVCTIYQIFFIRNNKLYCHVHMRSNDSVLGLPTDAAFFSVLMINMFNVLKQTKYPNLEMGLLTHISDSMHAYERNMGVISEMINLEFTDMELPEIPILIDERNVTSDFMKGLYYKIMNPDKFDIKGLSSDFEFWMCKQLEFIQ